MSRERDRDEPQFLNVRELPWEIAAGPRSVAGLEHRLLGRDGQSAASTLLARIPPGWRGLDGADEATTELLVLAGELALDGELLGTGGYAYLPRGGGQTSLASEGGAEALLFCSPTLPVPAGASRRVTSIWDEPWQEGRLTGLPYGRRFKSLRAGDVTDGPQQGGEAGFLRLNHWLPGYVAPNEHRHAVWEELLFLQGDWLTLERGLVGAGSYLGNPAGWWHGPLVSRYGALALVHSDRPLDLELRELEGGAEFAERYLRSTSLLEPAVHAGAGALEPYLPAALAARS